MHVPNVSSRCVKPQHPTKLWEPYPEFEIEIRSTPSFRVSFWELPHAASVRRKCPEPGRKTPKTFARRRGREKKEGEKKKRKIRARSKLAKAMAFWTKSGSPASAFDRRPLRRDPKETARSAAVDGRDPVCTPRKPWENAFVSAKCQETTAFDGFKVVQDFVPQHGCA